MKLAAIACIASVLLVLGVGHFLRYEPVGIGELLLSIWAMSLFVIPGFVIAISGFLFFTNATFRELASERSNLLWPAAMLALGVLVWLYGLLGGTHG